jgi:hypothetical protein
MRKVCPYCGGELMDGLRGGSGITGGSWNWVVPKIAECLPCQVYWGEGVWVVVKEPSRFPVVTAKGEWYQVPEGVLLVKRERA